MEDQLSIEIKEKYAKKQTTLSFLMLSFLTFGLYQIYWMYKQWAFIRDKENIDILPAVRAIFTFFYIHGLLNRINKLAKSNGIEESASFLLAWGFIVFIILGSVVIRVGEMDNTYLLISFLFQIIASLCLFHPVEQLNKYWGKVAPEFAKYSYSMGEIITLIVFGAFWFFFIIGLNA